MYLYYFTTNAQSCTLTRWYHRIPPWAKYSFKLPIIQRIILLLSTPLFKRKLPIILKKADKKQMKHEYDQNVHVHRQQVLDYMRIFFFIVSSEAKGTFSTPKND